MINLEFPDQQALEAAYLPFVQNGALTTLLAEKPTLGTQVEAQLVLTNTAPIPFSGKIVLIQKQTNGQFKVGVQLTEEVRQKISL